MAATWGKQKCVKLDHHQRTALSVGGHGKYQTLVKINNRLILWWKTLHFRASLLLMLNHLIIDWVRLEHLIMFWVDYVLHSR